MLQSIVIKLIGFLIAVSGMMSESIAQQNNRIEIDGQPLFLNDGNIAWINFARDIGPGETRLDLFEDLFRTVNEHGGTAISPFHHDFSYWELDKPTAVTEFYVQHTFNIPVRDLYQVLYDRGYAGAMGWQWIDHYRKRLRHPHNWENTLRIMRHMMDNHPESVKLLFRENE